MASQPQLITRYGVIRSTRSRAAMEAIRRVSDNSLPTDGESTARVHDTSLRIWRPDSGLHFDTPSHGRQRHFSTRARSLHPNQLFGSTPPPPPQPAPVQRHRAAMPPSESTRAESEFEKMERIMTRALAQVASLEKERGQLRADMQSRDADIASMKEEIDTLKGSLHEYQHKNEIVTARTVEKQMQPKLKELTVQKTKLEERERRLEEKAAKQAAELTSLRTAKDEFNHARQIAEQAAKKLEALRDEDAIWKKKEQTMQNRYATKGKDLEKQFQDKTTQTQRGYEARFAEVVQDHAIQVEEAKRGYLERRSTASSYSDLRQAERVASPATSASFNRAVSDVLDVMKQFLAGGDLPDQEKQQLSNSLDLLREQVQQVRLNHMRDSEAGHLRRRAIRSAFFPEEDGISGSPAILQDMAERSQSTEYRLALGQSSAELAKARDPYALWWKTYSHALKRTSTLLSDMRLRQALLGAPLVLQRLHQGHTDEQNDLLAAIKHAVGKIPASTTAALRALVLRQNMLRAKEALLKKMLAISTKSDDEEVKKLLRERINGATKRLIQPFMELGVDGPVSQPRSKAVPRSVKLKSSRASTSREKRAEAVKIRRNEKTYQFDTTTTDSEAKISGESPSAPDPSEDRLQTQESMSNTKAAAAKPSKKTSSSTQQQPSSNATAKSKSDAETAGQPAHSGKTKASKATTKLNPSVKADKLKDASRGAIDDLPNTSAVQVSEAVAASSGTSVGTPSVASADTTVVRSPSRSARRRSTKKAAAAAAASRSYMTLARTGAQGQGVDDSTAWETCSESDLSAFSELRISSQGSDASQSTADRSSSIASASREPEQDEISIDEDDLPQLQYQIPQDAYTIQSEDGTTRIPDFNFRLYKHTDGREVKLCYHKTFEQAQTAALNLQDEPVLGFDLEWEIYSRPGVHDNKRCVSMLQLASENSCHLFHLALFDGDELIPPALRALLVSPSCIKTGVNISGDASRLKKCFDLVMQGVFELSHLYKLVTYAATDPGSINKIPVRLAQQVEELLLLPMHKGEVRTGAWSKKLDMAQLEYAASDAYAGFRLFHRLEEKRRALDPRPPRPAFHELGLPIVLADGSLAHNHPSAKPAAVSTTAADEDDEQFYDALENQEDDEIGDTITPVKIKTKRQDNAEVTLANEWVAEWRLSNKSGLTPAPLRAYHLWHYQGLTLEETAGKLRQPPILTTTVAGYIAEAISRGKLEYDAERTKEALQSVPRSVLGRYKPLLAKLER